MFKRFYMAKYPHLSEDQACVYFIHCHKCPHDRDEYFKKGFLKIGMSGDLKARFHALDNDCHGEASMVKAVMLNTWREAWEREQSLHKQFQLLRFRGEWFYYTPYLKRWVKKFAQHIGPPAAVSTEPIAPDVEVKKEEREPSHHEGKFRTKSFHFREKFGFYFDSPAGERLAPAQQTWS